MIKTKIASCIGCALQLLCMVFCCVVTSAYPQALEERKEINAVLLDRFKDCSIDLRYENENRKLMSPTHQISERKIAARIKDGYASIYIRLSFHNLHVRQITLPTRGAVYTQYRLQIEAPPAYVRKALQQAWNVEFEETGPDGMDNAMLSNYRIRSGKTRVNISSATEKSKQTYLECSPLKTSSIKE